MDFQPEICPIGLGRLRSRWMTAWSNPVRRLWCLRTTAARTTRLGTSTATFPMSFVIVSGVDPSLEFA